MGCKILLKHAKNQKSPSQNSVYLRILFERETGGMGGGVEKYPKMISLTCTFRAPNHTKKFIKFCLIGIQLATEKFVWLP